MSAGAAVRLAVLPHLSVQQHDGGLEVSLDRPDRRNALGRQLQQSLHAVCGELESDPQPLLLTSNVPGVFAAAPTWRRWPSARPRQALAGEALRLLERIAALPMPTVALIGGPALGGGAELAYACDIRIGSPAAVFAQPEVRLGILAEPAGCTGCPRSSAPAGPGTGC
jgi:enoyl-CoA hydratase/carnithine racemase